MTNIAPPIAPGIAPISRATTASPTRALRELPNEGALSDQGIELPLDQARLVLCALSHVICAGKAKRRTKVYNLLFTLRFLCAIELETEAGVDAAPHPQLKAAPVPGSDRAMRDAGITHLDLIEYWPTARNRAHDACAPIEWVLAFVPALLWPLVAAVIGWGPERTRARMEEALVQWARTPVARSSRRREEGATLAAGTLKNRTTAVWELIDVLTVLRARAASSPSTSLPFDLLERWTHKPTRPDPEECGAKEAHLDGSGPPLAECSARLRELHTRYKKATPGHNYFAHRRFVVCALLSLYGMREDALRLFRVEDYLPHHVFADGIRSAGLRLFPAKTRALDEAYTLPVPAELACHLEAWIEQNGCTIGERDLPFLHGESDGRTTLPLTTSGIYCLIAGRPNRLGSGSLAILPRGENPYVGYHPHAFRHTAYQGALQAGARVRAKRPEEFGHFQNEDFAAAVVGHELVRTVGHVYRDADRERLARAAIEEAWPVLWNGGVLRSGPDPTAIRIARAHLETLLRQIAAREAELRLIEQRETTLAQQVKRLEGDALARATVASHATATSSYLLRTELTKLHRQHDRAVADLERATRADLPLPSDIDMTAYEIELAQALQQSELDQLGLSDELAPEDLAELLDVAEQSINRWQRDGLPSGRRDLWNPDGWALYGPRRKRLAVAALNQSRLSSIERERLPVLRRRRWLAESEKASSD